MGRERGEAEDRGQKSEVRGQMPIRRIIQLYAKLCKQKEFVLSKQLLRSGTSIGANVEEVTAAQSRKDFISKMAIASKEARETHYWLRLFRDTKLCPVIDFSEIINDKIQDSRNGRKISPWRGL